MSVIEKNWDDYEFDFVGVPLYLKFKILLCLQSNRAYSITENDLYVIFTEEDSLKSEVSFEILLIY
jgi:hypothetical protein